jgi:hypothetical protein
MMQSRFPEGGVYRIQGRSERDERATLFGWLRRRQEARRLAQADAEALIRDHGAEDL